MAKSLLRDAVRPRAGEGRASYPGTASAATSRPSRVVYCRPHSRLAASWWFRIKSRVARGVC